MFGKSKELHLIIVSCQKKNANISDQIKVREILHNIELVFNIACVITQLINFKPNVNTLKTGVHLK